MYPSFLTSVSVVYTRKVSEKTTYCKLCNVCKVSVILTVSIHSSRKCIQTYLKKLCCVYYQGVFDPPPPITSVRFSRPRREKSHLGLLFFFFFFLDVFLHLIKNSDVISWCLINTDNPQSKRFVFMHIVTCMFTVSTMM